MQYLNKNEQTRVQIGTNPFKTTHKPLYHFHCIGPKQGISRRHIKSNLCQLWKFNTI